MTPAAQAVTIPAARPISGFRLHPRLCWPGVITQMDLAPAKVPEGEIVWEVTAGTSGRLVGDRNEWLPAVQAALRKLGMVRLSLMRSENWQPTHRWSAVFGRVRSRLETVFGHLTDPLSSEARLDSRFVARAQSLAAHGAHAQTSPRMVYLSRQ